MTVNRKHIKFCPAVINNANNASTHNRQRAERTNCSCGCRMVNKMKLEVCVDYERQFKIVKRSQAPGDATVHKRVFFIFFVVDLKE